MKIKVGVTSKFVVLSSLLVVLVSAGLLSNLLLDSDALLSKTISRQVDTYGELFNLHFGNITRLSDDNYTNKTINSFIEKNKDYVLSLHILLKNNTDPPFDLIIADSSDKEKIGLKSDYNYMHINASEEGSLKYKNIEGTNKYVVVEPIYSEDIKDNIGTYEMVLNLEGFFKPFDIYINNTINTALFAFVMVIFISILISYVLIQKPVSKLKEATLSLGKGNLDTRAEVKSKDEFGDLANTFNKMARELKKSRDKIEDYNRILEKLLDQKDEFIGQLGHDLKNPMQPLVGLLPILIENEKDPDNKEMLEVMHSNVEYMQDLIFDTLKLAKLRSDNIDFDYEKIDLKKLSDQVVNSQKTMFKEKNIKIVNNIKEGIMVYADRLRLSEVFKNLINNSVKYTKDSGGKIILDAKKQNQGFVKISIRDTGIGMTKDQIKKVFDEFYKADRQTSDYHSTGLGLAICKRIVEKHGGKIRVESKGPDKGSTFYFTIRTNKFSNSEK